MKTPTASPVEEGAASKYIGLSPSESSELERLYQDEEAYVALHGHSAAWPVEKFERRRKLLHKSELAYIGHQQGAHD